MSGINLVLLVNDSPAPADVLAAIQELVVDARVDGAGSFKLRLGTRQAASGDWPLLDQSLFTPGCRVQIGVTVGPSPLPAFFFVGYVASQSVIYGDQPGGSSTEIGGVDKTVLMNLQDQVKAWPDLDDGLIANQIFASYGIGSMSSPGSPVIADPEGQTLQRGTDIRFLRRLARRNGFEVYVAPNPQTGLELGYFQPFPTSGSPVATLTVRAGTGSTLTGLQVTQDMLRPVTVVADLLDGQHQHQSVTTSSESAVLGQNSLLSRISPAPVVRLTGTGLSNAAALQHATQAAVDRSSLGLKAEGVVTGMTPLHPCDIVTIAGAGAAYSGPWAIRSVRHDLTPDGYTQRFTAVRNGLGNPSGVGAAVAGALAGAGR